MKIYNTLTKRKEEFVPVEPKSKMYVRTDRLQLYPYRKRGPMIVLIR